MVMAMTVMMMMIIVINCRIIVHASLCHCSRQILHVVTLCSSRVRHLKSIMCLYLRLGGVLNTSLSDSEGGFSFRQRR